MVKIGVLGALVSEIEPLLDKAREVRKINSPLGLFYQGESEQHEVILGIAGTQKTNTAAALQALIHVHQPDLVFFTGVAGSLSPELEVGDVVLGSSLVHHDAGVLVGSPQSFYPFGPRVADFSSSEETALWGRVNRFDSDAALVRAANQAANQLLADNNSFNYREGVIATGDQVVFSAEKKEHIRNEFGALAVETEGAAFAQVAWANKVPFLVVRAISDDAHEQSLSSEKLERILSAQPIKTVEERNRLTQKITSVAENAAAVVWATIESL